MNDEGNDLPGLLGEMAPPPGLRSEIAAELRRQRLLRRRRLPLAVAAAVAVVATAAIFLMVRPQRHAEARANYILLLYESPEFKGGSRAEYGEWARQMRPLIVGGEELAGGSVLALAGASTPLPQSTSRLAGYFLVGANDDASAARVARACPHLRHGGAIVLRRIR